jgi:hypothetical protein
MDYHFILDWLQSRHSEDHVIERHIVNYAVSLFENDKFEDLQHAVVHVLGSVDISEKNKGIFNNNIGWRVIWRLFENRIISKKHDQILIDIAKRYSESPTPIKLGHEFWREVERDNLRLRNILPKITRLGCEIPLNHFLYKGGDISSDLHELIKAGLYTKAEILAKLDKDIQTLRGVEIRNSYAFDGKVVLNSETTIAHTIIVEIRNFVESYAFDGKVVLNSETTIAHTIIEHCSYAKGQTHENFVFELGEYRLSIEFDVSFYYDHSGLVDPDFDDIVIELNDEKVDYEDNRIAARMIKEGIKLLSRHNRELMDRIF